MNPSSPMESQTVQPMLIDGQWIANTDHCIETINPATGYANRPTSAATAEHVDAAVQAGRRAAADPAWRDALPHQRARILSAIADGMERETDTLARLQMSENGKVWRECRNQVASAVATFRYYAAVCETSGSEVTPARGNYVSMTTYEPYGVVAAITPWNSPLTMEAQKVAPALAAGNAVILKPSEVTPSTGLALGRIALAAGLPPGLLNVLPGTGAQAGAALVAHKGVGMISFTGGTQSGQAIAQRAACNLVPAALELGGKSPHIVFDDANLDAAMREVSNGIFEGSGQSCVAGSRLFVQRSILDAFLERLVQHARSIRVDMPDSEGAQMGPIATFAHRERVESMVGRALEEGGEVLTGGERIDGPLSCGAFYRPTIIAGLDNRSSLAQQEVFGPVLCVLPFDDEADLIAQANDSAFGLASGIWTRDFARAWRVGKALQAGVVWVNTYKQLSISTPFGGFKESGIGREKGISGMRLYQQSKAFYLGLGA